MGAQASKTDVLKQVLNEVSIDVLNRNSTISSAYSQQYNELLLANISNSKISGISQANSAKINVQGLSSSVANGELQSQLTAAISEKIAQEAPLIGYSANEVKVRSTVANIIKSNITNESLQKIAGEVEQKNKLIITNVTDQSIITNIVQNNEATQILELINTTNGEIIAALKSEGTLEGDVSQTTAPLLDFSVTGLIFIVLVLAGLFLFRDVFKTGVENLTKPAPMALIAGLIVFSIYMSFKGNKQEQSKPEETKEGMDNKYYYNTQRFQTPSYYYTARRPRFYEGFENIDNFADRNALMNKYTVEDKYKDLGLYMCHPHLGNKLCMAQHFYAN